MKKLEFDTYIGSDMFEGQSNNIVAVVKPISFIPHGKYGLDGLEKQNGTECFQSLYELGTYFADWMDLVENKDEVSATIHLNIRSLQRVFKGEKIISVINKIESIKTYSGIRDFNELI